MSAQTQTNLPAGVFWPKLFPLGKILCLQSPLFIPGHIKFQDIFILKKTLLEGQKQYTGKVPKQSCHPMKKDLQMCEI